MNIPELDELYALYRADLYRYLCRLTRDSAAAEDLLSETFLRALKGAVTFRGESGVKTWLFTIARNAWCESLRRQHPTASTDELVTAQYLADDTLHTHTETRALLHRVRELLGGYGTTDAVTNGVTARQRMEQALTDKAQRTFDALSDRSDLDSTLQVELCVEPDADSSSGYAPHAEHYSDVIYLDAPMDEAILDKVPSCLTLTIFWPTAATETDVQTVLREVKQLMEQSDLPMTYYHVTLLGSDGIVGSGVVAANAVG